MPPKIFPIALLLVSNAFMTEALYGHLKFADRPLYLVVLVSWLIAQAEYCFAVPADRIGHTIYSAAELETMQEVITLVVFAVFPSSISASGSRSITCWASVSSAWAPSSYSKALCTRR